MLNLSYNLNPVENKVNSVKLDINIRQKDPFAWVQSLVDNTQLKYSIYYVLQYNSIEMLFAH